MINQTLLGLGAVIAGAAIVLYEKHTPPDPVAADASIVESIQTQDGVKIRLQWRNLRDCRFSSLTSVQGDPENDDATRIAIERRIGVKGPRGQGLQVMPEGDFWEFIEPPKPYQMPYFILEAWHDCPDGELVKSRMLSIPMAKFFGG